MPIPLYLAQTATEFASAPKMAAHLAWMACHFSPYGTGLTNIPESLPPHSLLILNDRTPPHGHDPIRIKETLEETVFKLNCCGILLDFQRFNCEENKTIADVLSTIDCPIAISEPYAQNTSCAVFLPSALPYKSLDSHIEPWKGREIWLEIALDSVRCTVTKTGSKFINAPVPDVESHIDLQMNCHYHIKIQDDSAIISIWRNRSDLENLLAQAEKLGISKAVGLWQEIEKHL